MLRTYSASILYIFYRIKELLLTVIWYDSDRIDWRIWRKYLNSKKLNIAKKELVANQKSSDWTEVNVLFWPWGGFRYFLRHVSCWFYHYQIKQQSMTLLLFCGIYTECSLNMFSLLSAVLTKSQKSFKLIPTYLP